MNNLFLINETFTNGFMTNILDIISLLAILCAILVIVNKNPIISVLFLIGLFASISSYLILTGLSFIGLSYLIVYIGAVSILFLFILMLINIRISELQSNTSNSILLSFIIIISFNYILFQLLPYNIRNLDNSLISNNDPIFVSSKIWDGNLAEQSHMTSIGNIMYTNYNLWLIIASLILLLAMVGAIIITIRQKN
jgi:NADH-ubiquinone oxidoreductase chain 6